jgi:hypothetical protein
MVGKTASCFDLVHIHAQRTKHGARRWGQHEYAQAAIGALRAQGKITPGMSEARLVRLVQKQLLADPIYRALHPKVASRNTILRAAAEQGILKSDFILWRQA